MLLSQLFVFYMTMRLTFKNIFSFPFLSCWFFTRENKYQKTEIMFQKLFVKFWKKVPMRAKYENHIFRLWGQLKVKIGHFGQFFNQNQQKSLFSWWSQMVDLERHESYFLKMPCGSVGVNELSLQRSITKLCRIQVDIFQFWHWSC